MIKLTAALSPRPGWTVPEWLIHYRERHAPLTAAVTNFTRHGVRYLQNYALHAPDVPAFPDRDDSKVAVTELWFEDVAAIRAAYSEPDYFKYLRTDELRFCSFEPLIAGLAREVELFNTPQEGDKAYVTLPRHKIFAFRRRREGTDIAAFHAAWEKERGPAMLAFAPFRQWVRRYVQSQMLDEDIGLPGGVDHDLIDEYYFDSAADAVAFWSAYTSATEMAAEDAKHADTAATWTIFAQEHEVFGPLPE